MNISDEDIERIRKAAENEEFMRRLLTEPQKAAGELGITLPDEALESLQSAAKELIRKSELPDEFDVERIVMIWHHHHHR